MTSDADRYLGQLADPDEQVRARAAIALHRMNHPRALEACLRTLDDAPDSLHADRTPAVACLIEIGRPALAPLVDRLEAPDEQTRIHARRAVEGITRREFGFDGSTWSDTDRDRWLTWWASIGYDHAGSTANRAAAVARLRAWMRSITAP